MASPRHYQRASANDANSHTLSRAVLPPLLPPRQVEWLEVQQADDARCESLSQQLRSPNYKVRSPPRQPKLYPRLQTIEQLVERRVDAMHQGKFVTRSENRWLSFQGGAMTTKDADVHDPDKVLAIHIVRQSSAVVIQSYWRQYAAALMRRRLTKLMWKRQEDAAAWISASTEMLSDAILAFKSRSQPLSAATRALGDRFGGGLHYHLPASMLAWWLRFHCARASGKFLRRPPVVLRAIDIPISRALKLAGNARRLVSTISATMVQGALKSYYARRLLTRLRYNKRRQGAALRLQCFFRMLLAHRLVSRRRLRRAAVRIQCSWRCHWSRSLATRRRVRRSALVFAHGLLAESINQVAEMIQLQAAVAIQKAYRASHVRANFRHLASESQQRSWRQNPSKGFALFARMRYSEAALQLETCKRQGGFQEIDALVEAVAGTSEGLSRDTSAAFMMAESQMPFSFSASPTTLGADWSLGTARTIDWSGRSRDDMTACVLRYLQFWHAYALSHLFTFEATGETFNFRQARHGFEAYQRIDSVLSASTARTEQLGTEARSMVSLLSMHCGYRLAKCLFLSDSPKDHDQALSLALKWSGNALATVQEPAATNWKAEFVMLSAMMYFQRGDLQKSSLVLMELIDFKEQTQYSELELRFSIVLLLLRQFQSIAKNNNDSSQSDGLLTKAMELLQRCYQIVELWPGVGYYHGEIPISAAKSALSNAPDGSFLLHHTSSSLALDKTTTNRESKASNAICSPTRVLLLQVKLPDRVVFTELDFGSDGVYRSRKLRNRDGHLSVHKYVQKLPKSARIVHANGVRKALYCPVLRTRLQRTHPNIIEEREEAMRLLIGWEQWERVLMDATGANSDAQRQLRNETWSSLCLEVAKLLESSESWLFSLVAAQEVLSHSRDRTRRATANYLCARVATQLQRYGEAHGYIQHAHLEASIDRHTRNRPGVAIGLQTLVAVERGGGLFSRCIDRSNRESFETRLDRVSKLDRMCLKAWRFGSLATAVRGDPFSESLLLQRVQDEMFADCGDTFFLRSLLKAHVRAYLGNGKWYEDLHLELAFDCAARLVNKFSSEQRHRQHYDTGIMAHLSQMIAHTTGEHLTASGGYSTRHFPLDLLLLSWHHLPFMVCFEIAEVLYRLSAYRSSKTHSVGLIDAYQSLYGRLRGAKPRTMMYSAYEELILLRLAFLHASNVKGLGESMRHLSSAVECIDEMLQLRKQRAAVSAISTLISPTPLKVKSPWIKSISWPTALRVPIELSDAELTFVRGFLLEIGENMLQTPENKRTSWRSYRQLHDETMRIVATTKTRQSAETTRDHQLSLAFRAERLRGLRVYIGSTRCVHLPNVLHSNPYVSIWCEGAVITSQISPTWADLSPSWDEYVEFDVKSPHARIVISLLDRHGRFSIGESKVIGSTTVFMQSLLEAETTDERFYTLTALDPTAEDGGESGDPPQLLLSFQVILKPQTADSADKKVKRSWKRVGLWDLWELRSNLHGDFRTFAASPWIWSRFAELFRREHEFTIASWFFHKATALTSVPIDDIVPLDLDSIAPAVRNLIGLAICQRATMCKADWDANGRLLVDQAAKLLMLQENWDDFEHVHTPTSTNSMDKELATIRTLLDMTDIGPLGQAVRLQIPASSQWIKIPQAVAASFTTSVKRTPKTPALFYFNQDTGEYYSPRIGGTASYPRPHAAPLEYEDEEAISSHLDISFSWKPRGVVLMDHAMKQRVVQCRQLLDDRLAQDTFKWIAIFNPRRQEMQFFSQIDPYAKCSGSRRQVQPPSYVLFAEDRIVYFVLVIQDAFRRSQRWRQRRRLVKGIFRCACWLARELLTCRRRLFERSEVSRKAGLNCIYVLVERAQHLRAGDFITSDPYVVLTINDAGGKLVATGTTSVRRNTRNPRWNEEFYLPYAFTSHEQQFLADQSTEEATGDACLTMLVLDHDMIKSTRDEIDDDLPTGITRKDFLGRTVIGIDAFQHGKRMTADLELLGPCIVDGEDSEDEGRVSTCKKQAETRGTLTISMQWIHVEDHTMERRKSADGRYSIVGPKRAASVQKPLLPDPVVLSIISLRDELQSAVASVIDLTMTALDPLFRLHKRMTIAQAKGRTAEEAKVHEQRLAAVVSTQLAPPFLIVQKKLQEVSDRFSSVRDGLRVPVMTFIEDAFDPVEGDLVRAAVNKLLTPSSSFPVNCTTTAALPMSLVTPATCSPSQTALPPQLQHQEALKLISTELLAWTAYLQDHSQCLAQTLVQYFTVSDDFWPTAAISNSLSRPSDQLSSIVAHMTATSSALEANGAQQSMANVGPAAVTRQVEEKQRQESEKMAASVAKRKERIEREKRKRARQQR